MRIAPGYYGMTVARLRTLLGGQPDCFVVVVNAGGDQLDVMREDGLTCEASISFVFDDLFPSTQPNAAQQVVEDHEHGGQG